jgi:hypothetical protein
VVPPGLLFEKVADEQIAAWEDRFGGDADAAGSHGADPVVNG